MEKIRCSVGILTFNSGRTLSRALESVRDFDDIIVVDGGSTDATLEIAKKYDARIIEQHTDHKDESGRIADFAGVRNQYLAAARHEWIFALDSDEYIADELADEIRTVVKAERPTAFWVPRKYEYEGVVIERALNYPSRQMRFFHRSVTSGYIKPIHERIALNEGVSVRVLHNAMIVPIDDRPENGIDKWRGYIALESKRRASISFRTWLKKAYRECLIAGLYGTRLLRVLLFQRGERLPVRMEVRIFWYQWNIIAMLFKKIDRF